MTHIAAQIIDAREEMRRADLDVESFTVSVMPDVLPATAALTRTLAEVAESRAKTELDHAETLAWWFTVPLLDVTILRSPPRAQALVTQLLAALLARAADDAAEHEGEPARAELFEALVGDAAPGCRDALHRLVLLARQSEVDWFPGNARAWHRAAPLMFVPECVMPETPERWRRGFRDYLALTILIDDADDALEDIREGRATWPARRMYELAWAPMRGGASRRLATDIEDAVTLYRERIADSVGEADTLTLMSRLLRP